MLSADNKNSSIHLSIQRSKNISITNMDLVSSTTVHGMMKNCLGPLFCRNVFINILYV